MSGTFSKFGPQEEKDSEKFYLVHFDTLCKQFIQIYLICDLREITNTSLVLFE